MNSLRLCCAAALGWALLASCGPVETGAGDLDNYQILLTRAGDSSMLRSEGFNLVRQLEEDWWLGFFCSAEVDLLRQRGYLLQRLPSRPPGPVSAKGDNERGDGCPKAEPASGTFCPFDTTIPRCSESISQQIDRLGLLHDHVQVLILGQTYEGRPIQALRIGDPSPADRPRPQMVVVAGQHGLEWVGAEMAMRLARHYAEEYLVSPAVRELLADRSLVILPVANPDGYQWTFSGDRSWRKNRRPCRSDPFDGQRPEGWGRIDFLGHGVDINRNHSPIRDDAVRFRDCEDRRYSGIVGQPEAETLAIEQLINIDPARHPTAFVFDLHSFGNMLLLPGGYDEQLSPCGVAGNCSGPDLGALHHLLGTENPAGAVMRDELSGAPYRVGDLNRTAYPTSGSLTDSVVYGPSRALSATLELTFSDCGFRAERMHPQRLDLHFSALQQLVHRVLDNLVGLADGSYFDRVGTLTLPHIHRPQPQQAPALRVAARAAVDELTIRTADGQTWSAAQPLRPGVGYRGWSWQPADGRFPGQISVCAGSGECRDVLVDGGGRASVDLADPAAFDIAGGWQYDERGFWRTAWSGQQLQMTRRAVDLGRSQQTRLVFSTRSNNGELTVLVSNNGFSDCSDAVGTGCRIVNSYPCRGSLDVRPEGFRTEIIDVSDFDGQVDVQVRFLLDKVAAATGSFPIYDVVLLGWRSPDSH